jgi:2-dehydro-3-deoxyphosphogluconate aldolase/(4S)-4-hydroxy-2-oxoglutarate aldolase
MELILKKRVVPVAVIDRLEDALPLAKALSDGGLPIIEVTFRTPAAADCVRAIKQSLPAMLVGAGTLLDADQVKRAKDAGAQFGVAPGLNDTVVKASLALGMPFVPGVMTPSEVECALALGCKLQKLFPASVAGGLEMLKALAGPYAHTGVKFIPLGGVNAKPIVAAIGGSWMCDKKLIAEKNWAKITELTKAVLTIAGEVRAA